MMRMRMIMMRGRHKETQYRRYVWREALFEVLIDSDSLVFTCGMEHSHGGIPPPSHKGGESEPRNSPARLGSTLLFDRTELTAEKTTTTKKKKNILTGAMDLSCLFTRCILCQCYFKVFVVHFVFLGKNSQSGSLW